MAEVVLPKRRIYVYLRMYNGHHSILTWKQVAKWNKPTEEEGWSYRYLEMLG